MNTILKEAKVIHICFIIIILHHIHGCLTHPVLGIATLNLAL